MFFIKMQIDNVRLEFLGHDGFLISFEENGKVSNVVIDPYNLSDKPLKADLILITHSHYDHCSIKDITKLAKNGTIIGVPADAQSKITKVEGVEMHVIQVGEEFSFGNIKIETLPAYNVGKDFHPKKEGWFGYLIKVNGVVIYHAGDTDKIPEMENLTGYGKHGVKFVALLPVSGTYVMTAEEASEAAEMLKPDFAIPMHYGSGAAGTIEDAKRFVELCQEKGVKAMILEKI